MFIGIISHIFSTNALFLYRGIKHFISWNLQLIFQWQWETVNKGEAVITPQQNYQIIIHRNIFVMSSMNLSDYLPLKIAFYQNLLTTKSGWSGFGSHKLGEKPLEWVNNYDINYAKMSPINLSIRNQSFYLETFSPLLSKECHLCF